ncbi:Uncharacterised protein [Mycobacteroides abscessus]|nr:Uncharacterised protein [Mycobacteroides abscessus]
MRAGDEPAAAVPSASETPSASAAASSPPVTSSPVSRWAGRSSVSVMRSPLLRNAICWKRARRVSKS